MGQESIDFKKIWFFSHCQTDKLLEISKMLDNSSFDSALVPFRSGISDPIIKSFFILSNTKKIKVIAALPGYAATSEYIAMVVLAIKEIFPERTFYINVVEGGPTENPSKFNVERENIKNINKIFIKELLDKSYAKIMVSGKSQHTSNNAIEHNAKQLVLFEDLSLIDSQRYKDVYARVFICVADTDENANLLFNSIIDKYESDPEFNKNLIERIKKNIICGSKNTVCNKVINLKRIGLGGVLVSDLIGSNMEKEVIDVMEGIK